MITNEMKLSCIKRELQMRKRVYPRFVSSGRMTGQKAKDEIQLMEAILEDYQRVTTPQFELQTAPPVDDELAATRKPPVE